jgi:hypothetical protein
MRKYSDTHTLRMNRCLIRSPALYPGWATGALAYIDTIAQIDFLPRSISYVNLFSAIQPSAVGKKLFGDIPVKTSILTPKISFYGRIQATFQPFIFGY